MNNIITGNRLQVLAFGINTSAQTQILYHRKGATTMLQQPHTDLRDIDAINTNVGDIRATLAELARLRQENFDLRHTMGVAEENAEAAYTNAQTRVIAELRAELAVHIAWEISAYKLIRFAGPLGGWNASGLLNAAPEAVRRAATDAGQEA